MPNDMTPASAGTDIVRAERASFATTGLAAGSAIIPRTLSEVLALADVMCKGGIAVRKHMRDQKGVCAAIIMQACRWEMDPFAVGNKSYVVNDQLAYEAQLVAAVCNTRAPIRGRLRYAFSGQGAARRCNVSATSEETGEAVEYESPEIGTIKVKNSPLWQSDPDQQLGYFSARAFVRRHFPEVLQGVYTPEDFGESSGGPLTMRDIKPAGEQRDDSDVLAALGAPEPAPERATKPAAKLAAKDAPKPEPAETGEVTEAPSAPAVSEKDAKWAIVFTGLVRTDLESITDENGLDEFEEDHAENLARLGAVDADARAALEAEIAAKREALS